MKNSEIHRMQKNKKESAEKNDKSSRKDPTGAVNTKKKLVGQKRLKRGARGGGDDNDSVDSKGNVRNLIVTSEDTSDEGEVEDESSSYEEETSPSEEIAEKSNIVRRIAKREGRRAALKAREMIARKFAKKSGKESGKKKMANRVIEEEEDESSEEEEVLVVRKKSKKAKKSKKVEEEELSEEEDDEELSEDDEELSEEEDEDEDEDDDEDDDGHGFIMTLGIGDSHVRSLKPKRYNMKKESEEVQRFVKLMTTPIEENTIDDQIDHFKGLAVEKRKQLMETLEKKGNSIKTEQPLVFKILTMNLPSDVQQMILAKYNSLQTMDTSSGEYFKFRNWLEKVTSIPFGIYKEIPARIEDGAAACTAFMERAKKCMQQALYGQEDAKLQILQFIASKITNPTARGLSLLLVGPPGIGKTSLIKNGIAKALDWPFQFISLGGDSDATTYTGHQLVYEGSHCGKIVNSIVGAKSMSMVLMFDELDKISGTAKGEEVQNMLIHLTDPVQNADFEDKYLSGVPIDLSRVMFVFSGNDINKIDKVLLDRMIVVQLEGYSSKEKQVIAEQYLIPGALNETNLNEKVRISSEVIQHIISEYAGEEKGVRELKRSIDQIVQRINMLRIFNSKDLPFHIKDFSLPFVLKKEHIDLFLKKKDTNESIRHLYA
jgi:ATP-dependent Lon protease